MGITVYAYEVHPGVSRPSGFANSIEEALQELRKVREEIVLEDDVAELPTSHIYAYDLYRPDIDQLLAVLSGDAELGDLILNGKRIVLEEPPDA